MPWRTTRRTNATTSWAALSTSNARRSGPLAMSAPMSRRCSICDMGETTRILSAGTGLAHNAT
eukprot:6912142-Pyramimonas_sp.AAC.1